MIWSKATQLGAILLLIDPRSVISDLEHIYTPKMIPKRFYIIQTAYIHLDVSSVVFRFLVFNTMSRSRIKLNWRRDFRYVWPKYMHYPYLKQLVIFVKPFLIKKPK